MNSKNKIEVDNLSFSYFEEKTILDNISFSVQNENCVSFVGISGSGKTTLLKVICNLINSQSKITGNIYLNGIDNKEYIIKNSGKIGFMFQSNALMPNLNVGENIIFPSKIINGNKVDKQLFDEIIKMVGLFEKRGKFISELSGGMRSRLSLASVYMTKPEFLFLDEPFSSLDVAWKYELYQKFLEFKRRFNTTEIIVTHDIQEAILLSNQIYIIKADGTIGNNFIIERNEDINSLDKLKLFLMKYSEVYLEIQNEILLDKGNKKLLL